MSSHDEELGLEFNAQEMHQIMPRHVFSQLSPTPGGQWRVFCRGPNHYEAVYSVQCQAGVQDIASHNISTVVSLSEVYDCFTVHRAQSLDNNQVHHILPQIEHLLHRPQVRSQPASSNIGIKDHEQIPDPQKPPASGPPVMNISNSDHLAMSIYNGIDNNTMYPTQPTITQSNQDRSKHSDNAVSEHAVGTLLGNKSYHPQSMVSPITDVACNLNEESSLQNSVFPTNGTSQSSWSQAADQAVCHVLTDGPLLKSRAQDTAYSVGGEFGQEHLNYMPNMATYLPDEAFMFDQELMRTGRTGMSPVHDGQGTQIQFSELSSFTESTIQQLTQADPNQAFPGNFNV